MGNKKIVMLAGKRESTPIIYNALKHEFPIEKVIIEAPVSKSQFFKRRVKNLGLFRALGQGAFHFLIVKPLKAISRKRRAEILQSYGMDDTPIDEANIVHVNSVNADETKNLLQDIAPDLVLINGTRIITNRILECIPAPFINMHAGITPLYRGVHGAYWALVEREKDACGVTVHLVDANIDTGGILEQGLIEPTKKDNFTTHPLLQSGVGLPLLKKAVRDALEGRIEIKSSPEGKSRLWSHPTIWEYLWYWIRYGVK